MRILHLVHQYPPDEVGGTELYTQSLVHQLAGRGHEVAVFYRRRRAGRGIISRREGQARVYIAWDGELSPTRRFLATFYSPFLTHAFQDVLDTFQPDLVHIQHLMGLPLTIWERLRARGIPYLVTLHDYWWICANAQLITNDGRVICNGPRAYFNCARCALARAGRMSLRLAIPGLAGLIAWRTARLRTILKEAQRIIAPSRFVRDWYARHGIPAEQITVIPHGIDEAFLRAGNVRHPHEGIRIAYIGGLSWQKGVHILIEAFRQVQGAVSLWIAGDEDADPAYVADLRRRADKRTRFLGKLNRNQVIETLQAIDLLAVPSLWHETFSLIAHEALAVQVPVIASNVGALREAIVEGSTGFLLPPGDVEAWRKQIQRLIDAPQQLTKPRSKVYLPQSLSWHVRQIEDAYTISDE